MHDKLFITPIIYIYTFRSESIFEIDFLPLPRIQIGNVQKMYDIFMFCF